MSWFEFKRTEGYPTHYEAHHNAAGTNILVAGIICAILILLVSALVVLPAYKTRSRFIFGLVYVLLSLFIGGSLLVGNFGHEWEVGEADIKSPYKPASAEEIVGKIGLHVALRGINITLKGNAAENSVNLKSERIDYNEHFSWEWAQGRFGFGPYAGQFSRDFRAAVIRGIPIPILQLAEYFTFDGEGIRFGRHYRHAGMYAHFFMWCAFVTWVLSNILFFMVVSQGGYFLSLTGICQIVAILVWTFHRNSVELSVPFEHKDGSYVTELHTRFGPDYYVVLFNGILCVLLGLVFCILDRFFPERICELFGIDPLTAFDEVVLSPQEKARTTATIRIASTPTIEIHRLSVSNDDHDHVTIRRRKSRGKSFLFNSRLNNRGTKASSTSEA